jgi:hypothetical protein
LKNSEVPMMALRRAVQICNGLDALGDALNLSTEQLEKMLAGEAEIPLPVFTHAVGLLLEATATRSPKRSTPSSDGGRKDPRH